MRWNVHMVNRTLILLAVVCGIGLVTSASWLAKAAYDQAQRSPVIIEHTVTKNVCARA